MKLLLKNCTLVDTKKNKITKKDILIDNGIILQIDDCIDGSLDMQVIDVKEHYVMPGFIDMHVHLRDPGLTYKEDIESGSRAAAAGGVTTICAMPNTKPAVDTVETLEYVYSEAKKKAIVNILQISAITKNQDGYELVDMEAMKEHGACGFSEDGKSVMDIRVYDRAMKKAAELNMVVMAHCEDKALVGKGVLNKGVASDLYNVPGISDSVEDIITARDIFLARDNNTRLHLCHCSTKASVELVRMAKKLGIDVSAEVCPHHFTLCDEDITSEDSNYKMNPPLRSREDMEAIIEGLKDGTMEVISTDHAPHSQEEKQKNFVDAPFGIVGIENSAALAYTQLVDTDIISIIEMANKMSSNPARILGIDNRKGYIELGYDADIVVYNQYEEDIIDKDKFASKGKNTPFDGRKVKGYVEYTICNGQIVYNR